MTQIDPPGSCGQQQTVTICTIIEDDKFTDELTLSEINDLVNGKAWLYYQSRPGESEDCNLRVNEYNDPISLTAMSKDDGISLFCDDIGARSPGITTYYLKNTTEYYDYGDICSSYGQLRKGTAYVYCGDYDLSYESAAGTYKVEVKATDADGAFTNPYPTNTFEYVGLTDYQIDFTEIDYGLVTKDEWDVDRDGNNIGDEIWGTDGEGKDRPTVRNVGNTRLYMLIAQDDMGLSQVLFKARVGNNADDWVEYGPSTTMTTLQETLELSTMKEMDFGILTSDFMQAGNSYIGGMTFDVEYVPFCSCPDSIHLEYACPSL